MNRLYRKTGRGGSKFTLLSEGLQRTEAWSSMKPGPRALYIELRRRYNGHNNGEIFLSHRDAATALNVSKNTITAYFAELVERGFIHMTVGPHLGPSGIGQASKWALEEERTRDGKPAGRAYVSWSKKRNPHPKKRTPRPNKQDTFGGAGRKPGTSVPNNGT